MAFESGLLTRLLTALQAVDRAKLHNEIADDNVQLGSAATKTVGFYGTTPAVQPASASQAVFTVTATTALAATTLSQANVTTVFGFANSTVGALYLARVRQMQVDVEGLGVLLTAIRAALVTLGVMKGAA